MRIGGSGAVTLTGRDWESVPRNRTFSGYASVTGVAAEFSKLQLQNPAASGVIIYVTRVRYYRQNGVFTLAPLNAALATAVTTLASKQVGAAAPVGLLFEDTEATLTAATQFSNVTALDEEIPFPFDSEPFQLDQGTGLVAQHSVVNTTVRFGFEWVEVVI